MEHDKHKPILSVRIDAGLLKQIDELCERTNIGRAELVERCLAIGLADEDRFVEWLESSISGPLVHLMTHPAVQKAILSLTGERVDETDMKVRQNIADKKRLRRAKRAME